MRKFTGTIVAAALATLVPQLAQAAEQLYVAPFSSAPLEVVGTGGAVTNSSFTGGNLSNTSDVTFDSGGNVYVASFGSNTVLRYNSSGTSLGPITGFPSASNQRTFSMAFGPLDGALYVASPDTNNTGFGVSFSRVTNPSGTPSVTDLSSSLSNVAGYMAFGPTTTYDPGTGSQTVQPLYYDTYASGNLSTLRVAYINSSGTVLNSGGTEIVSAISGEEEGVAIGGGFVYVSNYSDAKVRRYDLAGNPAPSIGNTGAVFANSYPSIADIALDSAGNLYVTDISDPVNQYGGLYKYKSDGTLDTSFGTGGFLTFADNHSIYGLGITGSVPEPTSLALLGLGTMGLAFFRRQRGR
jgi:hypothetical protein